MEGEATDYVLILTEPLYHVLIRIMENPKLLYPLSLLLFLLLHWVYKNWWKRIESKADLPVKAKGTTLTGTVTRVGDGDGFEMVHQPLLRMFSDISDVPVLRIRLAGIDAPEMGKDGDSGQPYANEAKLFLEELILQKYVTIEVQSKKDQYSRILAIVMRDPLPFFPSFLCSFLQTNVNLKMLEEGYACVYEGADAKYGGLKNEFMRAQNRAKNKHLNMWSNEDVILPMQYKSDLRRNRNS